MAHSERYLAMGASHFRLRRRLLKNVFFEQLPSWEKIITTMLTASLFAEALLNLHGLGALTIRAISRSDWALVLGLVLVYAVIINLFRVISELSRQYLRGVADE